MDLKQMINRMTDDVSKNIEIIKEYFSDLDYYDKYRQSILHILVNEKYDIKKCWYAIVTLLRNDVSPNLEDGYKYNFIQTAICTGYNYEFIINCICLSLELGLDINHVDVYGNTIMHSIIKSNNYNNDMHIIYKYIIERGFDSSILDECGMSILDCLKKYSECDVNEKLRIKELYETSIIAENKILKEDIQILERFGKILNNKKYNTEPAINRENELRNLYIELAKDKTNPIIVGESGIGKTVIVEELAYRIQNNNVPNFLKNKIIYEVNPNEVVAGCSLVGQFEENMTKLMRLCDKYNLIVFIDGIHTIYGIGSTRGKDNDMAGILKHYIDRFNLKIIGTTTEKEYNEYFSNDALKRRFSKIKLNEPKEHTLFIILEKVIIDYCNKYKMNINNNLSEIINIIMDVTKDNCRDYKDKINNPTISISIIDGAFAIARIEDSDFVSVEHFIESLKYCSRIYDTAKQDAIFRFKSIQNEIENEQNKCKLLKINYN